MLLQAISLLMRLAKKRGNFPEGHPLLGEYNYKELIYPAMLHLFNE